DHVSRLVDVVGVDHVGIGTDMDGIPVGPLFTDYTEWPSIPAALLARGYRPPDVVKVMGGNFVRVFKAVALACSAGPHERRTPACRPAEASLRRLRIKPLRSGRCSCQRHLSRGFTVQTIGARPGLPTL